MTTFTTEDRIASAAGPDVIRRGFTSLTAARGFRQNLKNPEAYCIVEIQEHWPNEGPNLGFYIIDKKEELRKI